MKPLPPFCLIKTLSRPYSNLILEGATPTPLHPRYTLNTPWMHLFIVNELSCGSDWLSGESNVTGDIGDKKRCGDAKSPMQAQFVTGHR